MPTPRFGKRPARPWQTTQPPRPTPSWWPNSRLPTTAGKRVALIHALGYRADPASVEVLGKQLADADASVAVAAAGALGKIGGPEAARLLAAAKQGSSELRRAIADARLCCANQMLNHGNTVEAAKIYQELGAPSQPRPIRRGALAGQLRAAGDGATAMVLEWLGSSDADARDAAAAHVGQLSSRAAMAQLGAELFKLPAPSQVMLLNVLAAKGDKSAVSVAASAAKSESPEVRIASLVALGKLGDASVVSQLIELTLSNTPVAGLAREGLQQVVGAGVNEAIVAAMERAAVPARIQLIEVLEARGAVVAVPALLKQAEQQDAVLRSVAVRALGRLAEPKDVPALVALALKTANRRERDDVEKAIVFVCNMQNAQLRSLPVLDAYSSAKADERRALLAVLGRIGGPRGPQGRQGSDPIERRRAGRRRHPRPVPLARRYRGQRTSRTRRRRRQQGSSNPGPAGVRPRDNHSGRGSGRENSGIAR